MQVSATGATLAEAGKDFRSHAGCGGALSRSGDLARAMSRPLNVVLLSPRIAKKYRNVFKLCGSN